MNRVAVLGSLNIDTTVTVAMHPKPGQTVLGEHLRELPGGKGANQAAAAAAAGATVELIGRVGDDEPGRRYLAALRDRGVRTGNVPPTRDAPTGQAFIAVDGRGENTITVVAGANAAVTEPDIATEAIARADVLVLQLETPLPAVCAAARFAASNGVRVVLNASPPAELPADVLAAADPVIVNQHEAAALPAGLPSVCVTAGGDGARWGEARAAPQPVTVVDTTGAGDCFAGTLAAALAAGASRADALDTAVRAGATATTWHGAQGWQLG